MVAMMVTDDGSDGGDGDWWWCDCVCVRERDSGRCCKEVVECEGG